MNRFVEFFHRFKWLIYLSMFIFLFILEWILIKYKIFNLYENYSENRDNVLITSYVLSCFIIFITAIINYKLSVFLINFRLRLSGSIQFKKELDYFQEGILLCFILTAYINIFINLMFDSAVQLDGIISLIFSILIFIMLYRKNKEVLQVTFLINVLSFLLSKTFI